MDYKYTQSGTVVQELEKEALPEYIVDISWLDRGVFKGGGS